MINLKKKLISIGHKKLLLKPNLIGYIMAATASIIWGVQGNLAQTLYNHGFTPQWLVSVRLFCSGCILLVALSLSKYKNQLFSIWRNKSISLHLIFFSIFGVLAFQFSFFTAIRESSVSMAALLQYMGPSLIIFYIAFMSKRMLTLNETIIIIISFSGMLLLISNGNITKFVYSTEGIIWGIISAIAFCIYTIVTTKLVKKFGTILVLAWSMFIAGMILMIIYKPWQTQGEFTVLTIAIITFIILFGTILSFFMYTKSIEYISSSKASLLTFLEPFTAIVISAIALNEVLGKISILGAILILGSTFIKVERKADVITFKDYVNGKDHSI